MARPTTFPEQTMTWGESPGDNGPLPAYRDEEVSISKWELSAEEIVEILKTGVIWLAVYGVQPPVYVGAEYPFETSEVV